MGKHIDIIRIKAVVEQESTRNIITIFEAGSQYYWLAFESGQPLSQPFDSCEELLVDVAKAFGRTPQHWEEVFRYFYPEWLEGETVTAPQICQDQKSENLHSTHLNV